MNLLHASCPICAVSGSPIGSHQRAEQRWTCFECRTCLLQYWSPRRIEPQFYAEARHDTYERRRRGEAFLRERHRVFLRRARPGRLLDIGCGEGAFLGEASARGFDVSGLDLDPGNVATARRRGLARVECALLVDDTGALSPALQDAGSFDWVTAFEVLEHQADPLGFLRVARSLLVPGGSVCGSVPNRDRAFVGRDRARSDGDFPPHHFLWFSARALEAALRAAGFSQVVVRPVPDDVVSYSSFLENTLLGRITARSKRAGRKAVASALSSGASREERDPPDPDLGRAAAASRLIDAARAIKNIPFVPLAYALGRFAPGRARALYFEAA
jgi:2-polyprenyl-3-methyl-5-hydroxy-6-metoxy-1,4-benzoquinol methylase